MAVHAVVQSTFLRPNLTRLVPRLPLESSHSHRRDGRVAEGARLESVFRGNSNVGSNPTLSAKSAVNKIKRLTGR